MKCVILHGILELKTVLVKNEENLSKVGILVNNNVSVFSVIVANAHVGC